MSQVKEQVRSILEALERHFGSRATSMNSSDGLRIDFERSWIHARSAWPYTTSTSPPCS